MPELELTPTEPASTQTSLLRRLFRPKDIGFYIMIVLAWIGAVYTTYNLDTSRWYWHWLIPIFGLICIITQWNNVEPTLKARLTLVMHQVLHWGAVLALAFLLYMLSEGHNNIVDLIDDRQGSFMMTYTIALSSFLGGIYYDWRLCVVAVFILMGGIVNVAFSNLAPLLAWIGLGVVIVYFAGVWGYNRWQERRAGQTEG
jgi:MFS family permease